ncbi:hypothetical protein [Halosimplex amylolyticum]|uniref:hypothetical protein n=1 Tax=Halosimplex amylolyticum TaxID=3396616 RepID=UPI003F5712AB
MDDAALRERLGRIERRQTLVLALLVPPYLLGAAELFGYWVTTVAATVLALVGFALVVVRRRRRPATTE